MKTIILLLIVIFSLNAEAKLSVSNSGGLKGDLNRSGIAMQITVHYAKNKHDLDKLVMQVKNFKMQEGQSGIAFYSKQNAVCEVFVIQPKRDSAMEMAAIGHEVYHCTNGKFH